MITEKKAEKEGFDAVFTNERFKCAFIKRSENCSFGKVMEMKKHNETDEIFVLLKGKAVMLTLEGDNYIKTQLAKNSAYNVAKGTWHYLAVSGDAEVFVVENQDTTSKNSEVLRLDKEYELYE